MISWMDFPFHSRGVDSIPFLGDGKHHKTAMKSPRLMILMYLTNNRSAGPVAGLNVSGVFASFLTSVSDDPR